MQLIPTEEKNYLKANDLKYFSPKCNDSEWKAPVGTMSQEPGVVAAEKFDRKLLLKFSKIFPSPLC